jgi:carboxylate-amine ligase
MDFRAGDPQTIGLEYEMQLLDCESLDLHHGILPLLDYFPDNPYVKPESIQNTVEVITPVCRKVAEMHAHLTPLVRELLVRSKQLGMALCGAGTHPFSQKLALITPIPRYQAMEQRAGFLIHSQITFATHVHLGMRDGSEAVTLMRRLKPYLPLLIALSASSPFWRGYDTGCASYRHRILAASRSYGVPPSFPDWAAFCRFYDTTHRAGLFQTISDIHWDIRPRPHLGSLEVRTMDTPPTLSEAMALATFVRALVAFLREHPDRQDLPQPLPWWIEKENHYQASLHGLDATYIHNEAGDARPLLEVWRAVYDAVEPVAALHGEDRYFASLQHGANTGLSVVRQRKVWNTRQDWREVVTALVAELHDDCQEDPQLMKRV